MSACNKGKKNYICLVQVTAYLFQSKWFQSFWIYSLPQNPWKQHTNYWQTTEAHAETYPHNCTASGAHLNSLSRLLSVSQIVERDVTLKRKLYLTYLKRFFQGFSGNTLYLCKTAQGLEASWQYRLGKTVSESYSFHLISFYFPLTLFSWNFHFTPWLQVTSDSAGSSRLIYCNAHKGMSVLTSDHLHENTDLQRCILHKPWLCLPKQHRVICTEPTVMGLLLVLKEPVQIFV